VVDFGGERLPAESIATVLRSQSATASLVDWTVMSADPTRGDLQSLLTRHPPFDALAPHELVAMIDASRLEHVSEGALVMIEDAEPTDAWRIVCSGAVELRHQDEVIDVIEPGEGFGHLSLLSDAAPAFTVRVRQDAVLLAIGAESAFVVLSRPAGLRYVARTVHEWLVRTGRTVHALPELQGTAVRDLVRSEPLIVAPRDAVADVARRMTEAGVSGALVALHAGGYGLVTDQRLRTFVLSAGLPADAHALLVARVPAPTVPADRRINEAIVELLEAGEHCLAVVETDGRMLGLVTAEEIAGLGAGPFALRRALSTAADEEELAAAAAQLPATFLRLLHADLGPAEVQRVLTLCIDTATLRLIDLSIDRRGPAPVPWAWLALGSAARRELTLASDQDTALAYDDVPSERRAEVDAYFAALARDVTAGLEACGFAQDAGDVQATDPRWRMSASEWAAAFRGSLERPDRSGLVRAAVAFDFRVVGGALDVTTELTHIVREAPDHPDFLPRLARTITDVRSPLGAFGSLRGGSAVDLKRHGVQPVTNLARWYALAQRVTVSATLDRLAAVAALGALDDALVASLTEAFQLVSRLRLEHHAELIRAGRPLDNDVRPDALPSHQRAELRDALRLVNDARRKLSVYAPAGI
jgi:CBS domain-containing protein